MPLQPKMQSNLPISTASLQFPLLCVRVFWPFHTGILIVLRVVGRNPSMVRESFVMNVVVTALPQPSGKIRLLAFHNLFVML